MWMLIATLCIAWGDEAVCSRHVSPPTPIGQECWEKRKPLRDFLIQQAEQSGGTALFVSVSCKRGLDT